MSWTDDSTLASSSPAGASRSSFVVTLITTARRVLPPPLVDTSPGRPERRPAALGRWGHAERQRPDSGSADVGRDGAHLPWCVAGDHGASPRVQRVAHG